MPPSAHAGPPNLTADPEIAAEKARLRLELVARRATADAAETGKDPGAMIVSAFAGFPDALRPRFDGVLSGYRKLGTEIDPSRLIDDLARHGYRVTYPRTPPKGASSPLIFHLWEPGQPFTKSSFGVFEPPAESPVLEPDLLIVPLLGFDRRGFRLGYGQGYYDRTIAALRAKKQIVAVGVAFAFQEERAIPAGPLDQHLDWIVTERELIGPLGAKDGS